MGKDGGEGYDRKPYPWRPFSWLGFSWPSPGPFLRAFRRAPQDRVEDITEHIKAAFGDLSLEALSRSTEEFLKLAKSRFDAERDLSSRELEGKKELIDRRLEEMTAKLEAVSSLVRDLEKDRESKFGELTDRLREVGEKTAELNTTTGTLKEALSSSQARGQWGGDGRGYPPPRRLHRRGQLRQE